MEEIKKEKALALAITIKDGKIESKSKAKGINPFETIGLLFFQILKVCEGIEKQNN